ncbi:MAG: VIT domain-containing protein [Melioribacteraceae bacterium]
MKTKFTFYLFILFFLICSAVSSQSTLQIINPQSWGRYSPAIDEAQIVVKPEGIFSKIDLTLSVYTTNSVTPNTQLEIVLNFSLPQGSIVTDLWLWCGEEISKGILLDTWTASTIYESIVNRRRDPAILYKRNDLMYELRVYPLIPPQSRKFKIQYLVPNNWFENSVEIPLPIHILSTSIKPINKIDIAVYSGEEFNSPELKSLNQKFIEAADSSEYPSSYKYVRLIKPIQLPSSLSISFPNPMVDGLYLKKYNLPNEGFYQMAIFPGKSLIKLESKKVLFLVDYDSRKSTLSKSDIVNLLKSLINSNFSDSDRFNIFYSGLSTKKLSDNWIYADSSTLSDVLNKLEGSNLSSYSNLPTLLKDGYDFIKMNNDGIVYLISNSDQLGNYQTANQLLNDLQSYFKRLPRTYIFDFNNAEIYYYYFNNNSYQGNEYFYQNLTRITGGDYKKISSEEPIKTMSSLLSLINGKINSFDLYTTLEAGFCYSRYSYMNTSSSINISEPILQIGKYTGSFPFIIKSSGIYNSKPFTNTLIIDDGNIKEADSLTQKMWIGWYLANSEKGNLTNADINEIIYQSLKYNVLTKYTSFLCLEPGDTTICIECIQQQRGQNDGVLISVEEEKVLPKEFKIEAYPNPFNSQVNIRVTLPAGKNANNFSMKIYNILGEIVKTFELRDNNKNIIELFWDGKNDNNEELASGIYIFTLRGEGFSKSIKLVYMK